MKGVVLAGGSGTRLWPATASISKQLLAVYDKPMIYYPISTLMLAGVREILVISTPRDQELFTMLLGDGSRWGVNFSFAIQERPAGIAQSLIIAEEFLNNESVLLILGDNIFHGTGLGRELKTLDGNAGAQIFTYEVSNPNRYGILTLDLKGNPIGIEEKPLASKSNLAITGLYYFDYQAPQLARNIQPSPRGELEITSVIEHYLIQGSLSFKHLSRGTAWLDTGSASSLHDAASYIRLVEERTGLKIACPEEISWRNNWITTQQVLRLAESINNENYSSYLQKIVNDTNGIQ